MSFNSEFSEKELLNDLLVSEKHIASSYNLSIIETSNKNLRETLNKGLTNVHNCQLEILGAMNQRGWNETKEVDSADIENAKSKFTKMYNELL